MKKKILFATGVLTFSLMLFLSTLSHAYAQDANCSISITSPNVDGTNVTLSKTIEGTAEMPAGNHVWVLVHRTEGFKKVWWPQGEAVVDSETHEWNLKVHFGQPQDIGYEFEVAAIIVNGAEHTKLEDYWLKAMQTGDWRPIIMPPFECGPVYRTAKKTGH